VKCRFIINSHSAASQKTAFFIVPAVKTLKSHMQVEKSEKVKSKDGGPVLNISAVGSLPADAS
jgi:hypothetical protein